MNNASEQAQPPYLPSQQRLSRKNWNQLSAMKCCVGRWPIQLLVLIQGYCFFSFLVLVYWFILINLMVSIIDIIETYHQTNIMYTGLNPIESAHQYWDFFSKVIAPQNLETVWDLKIVKVNTSSSTWCNLYYIMFPSLRYETIAAKAGLSYFPSYFNYCKVKLM